MVEMEHIHYVYWLSCLRGIGKVKRNSLLGFMGSEEEIFNASGEMLSKADRITGKDIYNIMEERDEAKVLEDYAIMESKGINSHIKGIIHILAGLRGYMMHHTACFIKGFCQITVRNV